MPKKSKLMTNMLVVAAIPVDAAAVLAASRLLEVIMDARISSLEPPMVKSAQPTAPATAFTASSVSHIMYFSGRRMMAYRGYRMIRGIMDQPQPPMGLTLFSA